MKHSLHPLIQLSLPPCLCSSVDLKFSKLLLTPQETREEIGINQCLPRPFHPVLAVLAPKHPTRCLVAVIHTKGYISNPISHIINPISHINGHGRRSANYRRSFKRSHPQEITETRLKQTTKPK